MKIHSSQGTRSVVLALGLSLSLIACGDDSDNNGNTNHNDGSVTTHDSGTGSIDGGFTDASMDASRSGADSGLTDAGEVSLSDPQIAGVVAAVNTAEIAQGQLASGKATNAAIKDYANMMVTMHTAAQTMETTLLSTIGISTADSAVTTTLTGNATQIATKLGALSGESFDYAYIAAQKDQHQTVLDLIDQKLLPQAQNAQLKAFLQQTRTVVATHLSEAEGLMAAFQVSADGGISGGPDAGG